MIKKRYAILVAFLILLGITTIGVTMGLFDFARIHLFFEVNAVVTNNGQPVVGAEVTRSAQFHDKIYPNATTTTDAQGRFHFDALVDTSLFAKFPLNEPTVLQQLHIRYQGKDYLAWRGVKRNLSPDGEFAENKRPPLITCELTTVPRDDDKGMKLGYGALETICTW
jgi:hypothetical protein